MRKYSREEVKAVKQFAWNQMDAMWHDNTSFKTSGMVRFDHRGYTVVNPWMDEKTEKAVNPYEYYGVRKTNNFIREALKRIRK